MTIKAPPPWPPRDSPQGHEGPVENRLLVLVGEIPPQITQKKSEKPKSGLKKTPWGLGEGRGKGGGGSPSPSSPPQCKKWGPRLAVSGGHSVGGLGAPPAGKAQPGGPGPEPPQGSEGVKW